MRPPTESEYRELRAERANNPSWKEFLAGRKLINIEERNGGGYAVQSASGNTYMVTSSDGMDANGCYYRRWHCDCPARRQCRHIDAVIDMRHAEAAALGDCEALNEMEHEEI